MRDGISRCLRAYAEKDGRGYPDWLLRYAPILRRWQGREWRQNRILEIGANENGFARFAHAPVIAVDIAPDHLRAARAAQDIIGVVADGAALPFARDCFDVCVCMDTLEHLPEDARTGTTGEIVRVLKPSGRAVVAFPSGDAAWQAEQRVQAAYRQYTGGSIRWLEEHATMGLPNAGEIARRLTAGAGATHRIATSGNAAVWLWEWMWKVLMCGWPGRGNALFQALLRGLAPLVSRCHRGPCYRTMVWIEPKHDGD